MYFPDSYVGCFFAKSLEDNLGFLWFWCEGTLPVGSTHSYKDRT